MITKHHNNNYYGSELTTKSMKANYVSQWILWLRNSPHLLAAFPMNNSSAVGPSIEISTSCSTAMAQVIKK